MKTKWDIKQGKLYRYEPSSFSISINKHWCLFDDYLCVSVSPKHSITPGMTIMCIRPIIRDNQHIVKFLYNKDIVWMSFRDDTRHLSDFYEDWIELI